ncbi:MAG: septum formation initiator family protein [Clostridium sp.]
MASHRAANQGYVYGTAARNHGSRGGNAQESRGVVQYRQDMSHTVRKNQEKALQMNLPYVIMLTLAAVCALYICIGYLHVQSSMTAKIHNIETLEQQLEQLRSENDALQTRINTDMDLDHIYKVATEELGMVYANRNQVLVYDKTGKRVCKTI